MRTCLSCGLVFDASKASTTNLVARHKESDALEREEDVTLVVPPTALRRGQLAQVLATMGFLAGLYLFDHHYLHAAVQSVALVLLIVGRRMSAPWKLTVKPTYVLRQREWTWGSSIPRDDSLGIRLSDLDFDVDELRAALERVPADE